VGRKCNYSRDVMAEISHYADQFGCVAASQKYSISISTVYRCRKKMALQAYVNHACHPGVRSEVLAYCLAHPKESKSSIARRYNIARSTLWLWLKSSDKKALTAVNRKPKRNVITAPQLQKLFKSARWLTAQEVADNAGFKPLNVSSLASKWKRRGQIFAISDEGRSMFPAYALGVDGRPLPIMKEILAVFADKRQPLSIATWFAAANSWLRGKAPKDVVAEHGADVLFAARMEVAPIEQLYCSV
jgi:transposase-like protein